MQAPLTGASKARPRYVTREQLVDLTRGTDQQSITLHSPLATMPCVSCRLILETEAAHEEAADNARFLTPLKKYLEPFMDAPEFHALPESFKVLSYAPVCQPALCLAA